MQRLRKRWALPAPSQVNEPEFAYYALVAYIRRLYRYDQRNQRLWAAIIIGGVTGIIAYSAGLGFSLVGLILGIALFGLALAFLLSAFIAIALMNPLEASQTGERYVRLVTDLLALHPPEVLNLMQRQPESDRTGVAQAGQLLLNASWVLAIAVLGGLLALKVPLIGTVGLYLVSLVFIIYASFSEATEISNAATVISQAIHAVEIRRLVDQGSNDGATNDPPRA